METDTILSQTPQVSCPLMELGINDWNKLITLQHDIAGDYTIHNNPPKLS